MRCSLRASKDLPQAARKDTWAIGGRWAESSVHSAPPPRPSHSAPVVEPMARVSPAASTSRAWRRSEEHTSELQSLMRISYAVFCLKKKNNESAIEEKHSAR